MAPLGPVAHGLAAGLAGTAAMTASQKLVGRFERPASERSSRGDPANDPWKSAPAPGKVAKRLLEAFGREVPAARIGLLTNVVHWGYGTAWGTIYGLVQGTRRRNPLGRGLIFGTGVWTMSYIELVPVGLYEPPWRYPATTVAKDLSYHLVYGAGVAGAFELLARRCRARRAR